MFTIQLLLDGKIHIESVKTTLFNGPKGIVIAEYPYKIALQIQRESI